MPFPASTALPWRPPSAAPPLLPADPSDFEQRSEPVLVVTGRAGALRQRVATYRADLEDPAAVRWVSECSEGWTLEDVLAWRPLDWPSGLDR